MKLTSQEFTAKYTGVSNVGNTPQNKGECVGLVMVWVENLELKHFWGDAKDLFNNAPDDEWVKIKNAPNLYPVNGDIMIWKGSFVGSGGFGHTAKVLWSNKSEDSFTVLEQNNPNAEVGLQCEITTYKSWTHVLGWLRPKNYNPEQTAIPIKDTVIDWQDAEGNTHEVGWYIREWYIEKQKALANVGMVAEKQTIIDSQQTQIASLQSEAIADATKYKKLEAKYDELLALYNTTKDSETLLKNQVSDLGTMLSLAQKPIKEMTFWEFIKIKLRR